ncbi:MAG: hypothetical protein Tsb0010_15750 [Parvularculaceae bacterium]
MQLLKRLSAKARACRAGVFDLDTEGGVREAAGVGRAFADPLPAEAASVITLAAAAQTPLSWRNPDVCAAVGGLICAPLSGRPGGPILALFFGGGKARKDRKSFAKKAALVSRAALALGGRLEPQ